MDIIGRKEELKTLERWYHSTQAEFLAIYGRRRVGKTFLIRQYFETKKEAIFLNVTGFKEGKTPEQCANFMDEIGTAFYAGINLKEKNLERRV